MSNQLKVNIAVKAQEALEISDITFIKTLIVTRIDLGPKSISAPIKTLAYIKINLPNTHIRQQLFGQPAKERLVAKDPNLASTTVLQHC